MRTRITRSSEEGFTLVELMVAMAIFSLGLMAVVTMVSSSASSDRRSMQERDANFVAMEQLELLKGLGMQSTSLSTTTTEVGAFTVRWEVSDLPVTIASSLSGTTAGGLQRVDLVVGWGGDNANCDTDPYQCRRVRIITNYIMVSPPGT